MYETFEQHEPEIFSMADIEATEVEWLWQDFIPLRKVTILQGDPGEGKTTAMLQIIASLTTGRPIISSKDDEPITEPCNVIYQTAEDGLADTIKPRLLAAGADCLRVQVINEEKYPLTMTDRQLETALIRTKAKLVVLDPLQAYLGAGVDMHRANEIRPIMARLAFLAERGNCAIVLIGHMNKASMMKSSYRGLGSIDFTAAARSVIVCGRVKDEPDIRVLVPVKSSLAYEPTPVAFRLSKENGFEWIGEYEITAEELLSGSSNGRKIDKAKEFLKEVLDDKMVPSTELKEMAAARGIKEKTLRNAQKELGTVPVKDGDRWYTSLPEKEKEE